MNQNENGALEKPDVREVFRRRARHLRGQAFVVLGLIILLLGAAIWIFFEAAEITKKDVAVEQVYRRSEEIESRIANLKSKIPPKPIFQYPIFQPTEAEKLDYAELVNAYKDRQERIIKLLDNINKQVLSEIREGSISIDRGIFSLTKVINIPNANIYLKLTAGSNYLKIITTYATPSLVAFSAIISGDTQTVNDIQQLVNELVRIYNNARALRNKIRNIYGTERDKKRSAIDAEVEKWTDSTSDQRDELEELQMGLELVKQNEFKQRFGVADVPPQELEISLPFLIQTNVTRFGPMIVILFFVSILVNLYRYNIRLSAYYDARADAIDFIDLSIDPVYFNKLVSSLTPDTLDIGKPPKLPTEHAIDLAKSAVDRVAAGKKD